MEEQRAAAAARAPIWRTRGGSSQCSAGAAQAAAPPPAGQRRHRRPARALLGWRRVRPARSPPSPLPERAGRRGLRERGVNCCCFASPGGKSRSCSATPFTVSRSPNCSPSYARPAETPSPCSKARRRNWERHAGLKKGNGKKNQRDVKGQKNS